MPGRIEEKKLIIQSVRKPGQWMPIGLTEGHERPLDSVGAKAVFDVDILSYVSSVMDRHEGKLLHWVVKCNCCDHEQNAKKKYPSVCRSTQALIGLEVDSLPPCRGDFHFVPVVTDYQVLHLGKQVICCYFSAHV